jgi:hypothetical protein
MKKLPPRPASVMIIGAVIAGFLLILLVQANQPLGGNASVSDMALRTQSNEIVRSIGIVLVVVAFLLGLVLYIASYTSQSHNTTGGFQSATPVPTRAASSVSAETRSKGTRPASFPMQRPSVTPLAYLIGPGNQSVVIQHADFSIGRSRSSHLIISDPHISRHHARIVMQHGHFMLVNLSKSGTFVNMRPVYEATVLQGGDTIRIGTADFRFTLPTQQSAGHQRS